MVCTREALNACNQACIINAMSSTSSETAKYIPCSCRTSPPYSERKVAVSRGSTEYLNLTPMRLKLKDYHHVHVIQALLIHFNLIWGLLRSKGKILGYCSHGLPNWRRLATIPGGRVQLCYRQEKEHTNALVS